MRIAFVGKGGSGKTTLAALFAKSLADQGKTVLAIDADINQHLQKALGLPTHAEHKLSHHQSWLKKVLAHKNPRITPEHMIKTTPPGNGSKIFSSIHQAQRSLQSYITTNGNFSLLAIGGQTDADTNIRCYHSKTGVVELLLNHLTDGKNEYIVVDMTAGADAFASGIYDKFDLTIIVVEPTQKSVDVFTQYATQAKKLGVVVKAVGNKVIDASDHEFLQRHLGEDLIATVTHSQTIRSAERKGEAMHHPLEEENRNALETIQKTLDAQNKDWERYLARTIEIHRKNAQSWGSTSAGKDLEEQIDPTFHYPA